MFGSMANQNCLIYLNNPETLTKAGVLHKKTFQNNTHVRYFFHYKNGTDKQQKFVFSSKEKVDNLKKSITTHQSPELVGANTANNFLKSFKKNCKLNLVSYVEPNATISGILEGDFIKNDTVTLYFGNNTTKIQSYDIYQPDYDFDFKFDVDFKKKASYRLGDGIENTIRGQYGSNVNLKIYPKESGILKMTFNPRGGKGLLVFNNRGKIYMTDLKLPHQDYQVLLLQVEKGKQETFTFIPTGGLNFPIKVDFYLIQNNNDKSVA
jgi:hypothetical protein